MNLRPWLVRLHRWFGLGAGAFLFVAGLTGAVISWDHELDAWLNPSLYQPRHPGPARSALDLAASLEAAEGRARVRYLPLAVEPGQTLLVSVQPRVDPATGQAYALGYNQVALDPASGEVQGRREWGRISLSREDVLPFLYKLHYTMHLPDGPGIDWGIWFMGLIALAWVLDTLVAFWLSFPSWPAWRRSFAFRWAAGGHRLTFDLHRSGGLWAYLLVLMLAVTSVSMNLQYPVMRPLVGWFSELTPGPFSGRLPAPPAAVREPALSLREMAARAEAEARQRGWRMPAGGLMVAPEYGLFGVGFFPPGGAHGDGGLGNPWLYFDAASGALVSADIPGTGSAGDVFMQAMFPLHSGRLIGLPGRILVSVMGLGVAGLCLTGFLIWARKRRARQTTARKLAARGALLVE